MGCLSGCISVILLLRADNAVARARELIGASNPGNAAPGTIRKEFGLNIEANSVDSSDSPETALAEAMLFFSEKE